MTPYASHSDQRLLELLRTSDHSAFTEIYERYWERLFYKAGKKLENLAEAENMVQDIFLDIWRRRAQLEVTGELSHYLAVALKYKIIHWHTRHRHRAVHADQFQLQQTIAQYTTEEWLAHSELNRQIAKLVIKLPEKCQLAFRLREEGLSQREIAQEMGVSENTVETHIGRALKALRSGIANLFSFFF